MKNISQKPSKEVTVLSDWLDRRLPFLKPLQRHIVQFPMPPVSLWWGVGACLLVALLLIVASGLFLAINYTPDTLQAFKSIETIERRIPYGWLLRALHTGGVTMLFFGLYLHIGRGLWYGSYKAPRELVWFTGLLLMTLFMTTAFAGYVLPWGQMSYWGATVVTNAFESIPGIGKPFMRFCLGEEGLGTIALHRFFILHFVLGFLAFALIALHIICVHSVGSSNPTLDSPYPIKKTLPFHPYYSSKDGFLICFFLLIYAIVIFFLPDWLEKTSNIIEANPLQTPADITPEWYLAPFYAILRAVPSRLGGLIVSALSLLILFVLPWLDQSPRHNATYRPIVSYGLVLIFIAFITLGIAGLHSPSTIWLWLSRISLIIWFSFFLVLLPIISQKERYIFYKKDPS